MDNIMLKGFNFEGIHENELRKFSAWGSVEVKDRHGEIIPIDEVYKIMDIWMSRDSPIMLNHTSQKIGKGLNWERSEKDGKKGVLITGFIHKNYSEDDRVWDGIKSGIFEGLSIGGKARKVIENGQTFLKDLIGFEFSVVDRTGNQEATFVDLNMMAKSEEKMEEKIVKQEEEVSTETPEVSVDDRVAKLEEAIGAIMEKVDALIQDNAGTPEGEETEKAEEKTSEEDTEKAEEEPVEETEKEEDTEDKEESVTKSELETLKTEMSELKKQLNKTVVSVAKSERPATKVVEKKSLSFTDVMKGRGTMEEFTNQ